MTTYIVGLYLCDRQYGGPEEGGWWFDVGELCRTMKTFKSEARAIAYAQRAQQLVDASLNKGRRSIGSVLSTGRYHTEIHEDILPTSYPLCRPRYE